MKIHIATPELIVLEAEKGEMSGVDVEQELIRTVLEDKGIEQWSSIEIEDYTYCGERLIFAKPIKVYVPDFLARLLD